MAVLDQFFMLFPLVVVPWRRSYCVRRKTYHLAPIDVDDLWQALLVVGHITADIRPPAPPYIAHNVYWWWWLGLLRQKCTAVCLGGLVWHTIITKFFM